MKKICIIILTILVVSCVTTNDYYKNPTDHDLYTAILKNHYLLYNDFKKPSIILKAAIMDIDNNHEMWKILSINNEAELKQFIKYCQDEIVHTQSMKMFKNFPGNDPWGEVYIDNNSRFPSYKKLLPSEMIAMSKFSNKITGKCTSIAHYISSILRFSGVSEDDVFLLRMKSHTIGLFKYEDILYLIDNNQINEIGNIEDELGSAQFFGIYNDKYYSNDAFNISNNFYEESKSLKEYLENSCKIKFSITDSTENVQELIAYAYHSFDVSNPEYYLEYSIYSTKVLNIARKMRDYDEILDYLKENIQDESIYPDDEYRVMLPEQVIVYEKGNYKDQALLFSTLLKLNAYDSTVYLTNNNAYIEFEDKLIDISKKEFVSRIKENEDILFRYKNYDS